MCGRFTLTLEESVLRRQLELINVPVDWLPRYNISPSQRILTQTRMDGTLDWMNWGLLPFYLKEFDKNKGLINARGETVDEKVTFKQSFQQRRCLIPADGFYEWKRSKDKKVPSTPFYFRRTNGEPFYFAGIWDKWQRDESQEPYYSCALLTTLPNEIVSDVHDRMPVMLLPENAHLWLEEASDEAHKALLVPFPAELMVKYPVSRAVNSPAVDDPGLVEPALSLFN